MQIPIAKALSILAILGMFGVIAGITAVSAQDGTGSTPNYTPPDPTPEYAEQGLLDMAMASRAAANGQVPVIMGTPLQMPSGAYSNGRIVKADFPPEIPAEVTVEPMQPPYYLIHQDGESTMVSESTGVFMMGENQTETFQFLIDQMGRDKMQLIDNDFYEKRWSPFRADALAKSKRLAAGDE
jgi:hypothetical protein